MSEYRQPPTVFAVPDTEPETDAEPRVDVDDEDDEDDEPLRWYVIAAFVAAVVAGFTIAIWCTALWFAHCDDGRHKAPYTAGDSLRGTLCDSGHGVAGLLVPGGWLIGLVLATVALVRWGGSGLRAVLLGTLFLTPVALPPAVYAGLGLSSTRCSGGEQAAYEDWVDDGSKGTPPYDCRKF
jgi:hypothetical protein